MPRVTPVDEYHCAGAMDTYVNVTKAKDPGAADLEKRLFRGTGQLGARRPDETSEDEVPLSDGKIFTDG
jgi:hypothetical protein